MAGGDFSRQYRIYKVIDVPLRTDTHIFALFLNAGLAPIDTGKKCFTEHTKECLQSSVNLHNNPDKIVIQIALENITQAGDGVCIFCDPE